MSTDRYHEVEQKILNWCTNNINLIVVEHSYNRSNLEDDIARVFYNNIYKYLGVEEPQATVNIQDNKVYIQQLLDTGKWTLHNSRGNDTNLKKKFPSFYHYTMKTTATESFCARDVAFYLHGDGSIDTYQIGNIRRYYGSYIIKINWTDVPSFLEDAVLIEDILHSKDLKEKVANCIKKGQLKQNIAIQYFTANVNQRLSAPCEAYGIETKRECIEVHLKSELFDGRIEVELDHDELCNLQFLQQKAADVAEIVKLLGQVKQITAKEEKTCSITYFPWK